MENILDGARRMAEAEGQSLGVAIRPEPAGPVHEVAKSFHKDFTPPSGNDVVSLAVEFETPDDVDAAYASISAAGYATHQEPFDAFWGLRYATVSDPDGNHVDLYASAQP
jgi:uncharacterized glyoxalase superfamily protein PhnB